MRSVFYPRLVNDPFGDPALYVRLAHRAEALLFDCGDIASLAPKEALRVAALFLSHAHIDHFVGFDALLRIFLGRDKELLLFGPAGTVDRVAGRLSGYTWNLTEGYTFSLTVREWGGREATFRARGGFRMEGERAWSCPGGLLFDSGAYRVRAVPLDHGGIDSLAFALEEPLHVAIHKDALEHSGYLPGPWLAPFKDLVRRGADSATAIKVPLAGGEVELPLGLLAARLAHTERGMKICYVTDAAPTAENMEKIVGLAVDSHLLVIEATFSHEEHSRAAQRNHLTARLAGELGRRAGAARLMIFHHSPRYLDRPELLAEEANAAFLGGEGVGED